MVDRLLEGGVFFSVSGILVSDASPVSFHRRLYTPSTLLGVAYHSDSMPVLPPWTKMKVP